MPFPTSPTNGQAAVVNGVRYVYSAGNNAWSKTTIGRYTASTAAPNNGSPGDQWYNTNEDILYEFVDDGIGKYWVDLQSPAFSTSGSANVQAQTWGMSAVFGG